MSALTTLDGLAEGTALGIQVAGRLEHWQVADHGLTRAGAADHPVLPLDLFIGYLRAGLIYLRDLRPPEQGEWFAASRRRNWLAVVVSSSESQMVEVVTFQDSPLLRGCHAFLRDEFMEGWLRTERPPWETDQRVIYQLAHALNVAQKEASRLADMSRQMEHLKADIYGMEIYMQRLKGRVRDGSS